jgi:hypothetical protein
MIPFWAATAFPLTHIFLLRIADEWIYTVYTLPGFYLFAFSPFGLSREKLLRISPKLRAHRVVSIGGFIFLLAIGITNYVTVSKSVADLNELDKKIVSLQKDMSVILTGLAKKYYANLQTAEDVPTFEAFVEIRDLTSAQPIYIYAWYYHHQPFRWVNLSRVWKSYYQGSYPNIPLEEIQAALYKKALTDLDFVIVLADPRNEKAIRLRDMYPQLESDEWNLKINEYIYERLISDQQHWSMEQVSNQFVYKSSFGDMYVFRNLSRYVDRNK